MEILNKIATFTGWAVLVLGFLVLINLGFNQLGMSWDSGAPASLPSGASAPAGSTTEPTAYGALTAASSELVNAVTNTGSARNADNHAIINALADLRKAEKMLEMMLTPAERTGD